MFWKLIEPFTVSFKAVLHYFGILVLFFGCWLSSFEWLEVTPSGPRLLHFSSSLSKLLHGPPYMVTAGLVQAVLISKDPSESLPTGSRFETAALRSLTAALGAHLCPDPPDPPYQQVGPGLQWAAGASMGASSRCWWTPDWGSWGIQNKRQIENTRHWLEP